MNTLSLPLRRSKSSHAGFSLVEVTLAIGIVAFAFIALFGMVPTGLNVFRGAIDTSIGSQIVQQVTDFAQQTDYTELIKQQKLDRTYYDEQGTLLTNSDGTPITAKDDPRSIYTVEVIVKAQTAVPALKPQASDLTKNVATLIIQIAKNPGHNPEPFTSNQKVAVSRYVTYVARNIGAFNSVSTTK